MKDFDTLQFVSRERKRKKSSVRFYREEKVKKLLIVLEKGRLCVAVGKMCFCAVSKHK